MMPAWLLPFLVFFPLLVALLMPLVPEGKNGEWIHLKAILAALVLLTAAVYGWNVPGGWLALPQAVTLPWLPNFGISFALGADGTSMTLATLNALLAVLAIAASFTTITKRLKLYYSMVFLLIGSVMGVFLARDLFLFFLFFELELIPMYLLIAIWGGPKREFAAMKFVLYTLFGSVFLVAAMLGLYQLSHKLGVDASSIFMFDNLKTVAQTGGLATGVQVLLFLGFFIAFAVKLPVVPFHTWLPDAHVEAPTPISMLLAGILLKMGAYGMLRFCFEWFPLAAKMLAPYLALLAFINIVYTAGVALVQEDMKKLIAYSSVSHMGFVLLALASLNAIGTHAAVFVMVSHGLVSAALFMGVGMLYRQTHSRQIADYGGVASRAPVTFYFFMLMSMASLGLPLLVSFAGESLVFYGAFLSTAFSKITLGSMGTLPVSIQGVAALSALGIVIGAAYTLWLLKRVFFGEPGPKTAGLKDACKSEVWVMASLSLLVVAFGLFPQTLMDHFRDLTPTEASPRMEAAHTLSQVVKP